MSQAGISHAPVASAGRLARLRGGILAGVLLGLFAAFSWAAYSVAARFGLDDGMSAWDLTALRFMTSGMVMAPFLWRRGMATLGGVGWRRGILFTACAGPGFSWLYTEGLRNTPFSHGPVIGPSTISVATLLLSAWLLKEKVAVLRWVGVLVVIAGLVLVADSRADGSGFGPPSPWDAALLASGLLWAVFTLNLKRWSVDGVTATAIVCVMGLVIVTPAYLLTGGLERLAAQPEGAALQAFFQGIVSAVLATLAYSAAVARLGASRGGIFPSLVPSLAELLAIPVLGIVPTLLQGVGIALASVGLVLALGLVGTGRGRPMPPVP